MAEADVEFSVNCGDTKLGEVVFVVGSHEAVGSWSAERAVPLTTTASTFPRWSSPRIPLPAGAEIEFKYLVNAPDRKGTARWEAFVGNRKLTAEAGKIVTIDAAWGDIKVACNSCDRPAGPSASKVLAGQLQDREDRRRNFSQSLMSLDVSLGAEDEQHPEDPADVQPEQPRTNSKKVNSAEGNSLISVNMSRVMSFSALGNLADADEKEEARKGRSRTRTYEPYNLDVPVVIVTSEVAPFSKTGGLGLVAASYCYEFSQNGHRTMVVAPKYQHYEGIQYVGETKVAVNGFPEQVKFFHKWMDYGNGKGCDFIFVDHPCIEREGGLYNADSGKEYEDNVKRFTLLCLAAMEAPLILPLGGVTYGDKVMFVANDWQSGLVPVYLCYKYRRHGVYTQARVLYVVHNLGYQGRYHLLDACQFFGLEPQAYEDIKFGNCANLSKGALICADRVITVSPNYVREIQTREGGFGLEEVVKGKAHGLRLAGILNGIDDNWDPSTDRDIAFTYTIDNFEEGKRINKQALQKRLGLEENPKAVVMGFVGRLTWQKGVDVLADVIGWMLQEAGNGVTGNAQLIMMGHGEPVYAEKLRWAEGAFKGKACGYVGFDPKVEHQMMAGCDFLIMPSRYEPCGLPQMYSQIYGTLPIVTATGGLVDSVKDVSMGLETATGFHIPYLDAAKMKETLWKAMEMCLKRPNEFRQMQRNAMNSDFYWPQAMDQYEQNIDWTLYDPCTSR